MGVMQYLLDTNICIYIAKNKPPEVYTRFANLEVGQVGMSIITFGELWYGAQKSQHSERSIQKLMELTRLIPAVNLNMEAARYFGVIRNEAAKMAAFSNVIFWA